MLGGGNPVSSSNPSGVGSGINYVGNHAYAHSGKIETANQSVEVPMLRFATGNSYIDSKIVLQHAESTTDDINFSVLFNGETIIEHTASRVDLSVISSNYLPILIPPFTEVLIQARNDGGDSPRTVYAVVRGEVYA